MSENRSGVFFVTHSLHGREAIQSVLIGVIHRLDKLDRRHELHPPILLLARQSFLIKPGDVLDIRHE